MTAPRYDVLGIGNAIVDVIARADDDFLVAQGMHKGTMALIDEARAQAIYAAMGPAVESSGGSAANTIVGVASFGARAAFVGKVKDDELGRAFAHDIRAAKVAFETRPASAGPSTARCYIMVTPDGERTMNTYLGAAQDLKPGDIGEEQVASAAVTYLEGYLWDPPQAKEAFVKAAGIAHKAGRHVALMLFVSIAIARSFLTSSGKALSTSYFPTNASCTASTRRPTSTAR
jgi:sugar/nucleoside kinase (ribokinase family)